ncbi:hypothetical protein AUR64_08700 [Haloprofundus marisrubri]|uniref:Uncharacterized protein n=1 Tax=Haloprofundus marisrubri TaxID=1514971 RepID=A0A0W1R8T5_9EURY|nr:DUF5791 family protein [Haloprofundus marisrubri]KTG09710.1 hypothetical protein AUR64_08700 [Haloprofundus marisrubri]
MLYDAAENPGSLTADELRAAYDDQLAAVVDDVGVETVAAESGVDRDRLAALSDGESPDLTLEEAAGVLAASDDYPDQEAIVLELRDHLLMGMTTGVLDVDTIASNVDADLTGQEVQQALEGRTAFSLDDLAAVHQFIAERNDR